MDNVSANAGEVNTATSRDLVGNLSELPSLPTIYVEIKKEVDNPNSSITRIGEVISHDQGLTARLLRLGNSAFFGFPRRIDTITEAVSVIGLQHVRDLALCTKIIELFEGIPPDLIDTYSFWTHSIGVGISARVLAAYHREPNVERYFVAGLLHDIGRLVMCIQMPDRMRAMISVAQEERQLLYRIERETLGYDHADVGAALLEAWDLPEPLIGGVAWHHRPLLATAFQSEASFVHVADIFSHGMELGNSGEWLVPPLSPDAWQRVNLKPTIFSSAMREIDRQFAEVARILMDPHKK